MGPLLLTRVGDSHTLALINGDAVRFFDLRDGTYVSPEFIRPSAEQQAVESAALVASKYDDTEAGGDDTPSKAQQSSGHHAPGTRRIINVAFSGDGSQFVAIDELKTMTLFSQSDSWRCQNTRFVPRKSTAVAFDASHNMLVADRGGDLHLFSPAAYEEPPKTCLGLLSMLMDVVFDASNSVVITADRDEKIRVSRYPNSYNIQSYCLGHSSMVTAITLVPARPGLLVSTSADGSLRTWRYMEGKQLHCLRVPVDDASENEDGPQCIMSRLSSSPANGDIAAIAEKSKSVFVYSISDGGELVLRSKLDFNSQVVSAVFTADGSLFVSTDDSQHPVSEFRLSDDHYNAHSRDSLKLINENATFGAVECLRLPRPSLREHLKQATDWGVNKYFERKEQRAAQLKAKKGEDGPDASSKRVASDEDEASKRMKSD